ncbi:MAG: hypothetical protein M3237_10115, partial [Actinomycetota bacterium]|nr:hypothetical protein [Actinomycetota bacterium]
TTLVAVLLTAFTWPTSQLEPRSLPVVVAGPDDAADRFGDQLGQRAGDDAFDVSPVADRAAAVDALRDREAYAGFVPSPDGQVEILVASAASPVVAQLLGEMAGDLDAEVTDIVAAPADDPRGATFGAGALPLVLGGLLTGAVASLALSTARQRIATALGTSASSGLVLAGVLQGWLDVLEGSYWADAGVIALGIAAISLSVVGLGTILGHTGIGLAALTMLLVGNPLSGITSAPELLPLGWLGQLLPPGATGTALRSTAFFDGAGSGLPLLVLTCWTLAGLALAVAPGRRS